MTLQASPRIGTILATLIALATTAAANALSVQDIAQLRGYGESQLWGIGIVTGLAGTGDGTDVLPLARPIAASPTLAPASTRPTLGVDDSIGRGTAPRGSTCDPAPRKA